MIRKYVESQITWRGSLTDLLTDVAYLLTPEEGEQLAKDLDRYLTDPDLAHKWQGQGHKEFKP